MEGPLVSPDVLAVEEGEGTIKKILYQNCVGVEALCYTPKGRWFDSH
jgi:hypothetical protein